MGEGTDQERLEFEQALQAGDPEIMIAYYQVSGLLAEIPNVLSPVAPPPFVKDRVLAKVRVDAEQFVLPERIMPTDVMLEEPAEVEFTHQAQILTVHPQSRVLNFLSRRTFARAASIGIFMMTGMLASAYAVNEVTDFVLKTRVKQEARAIEIERRAVEHYTAPTVTAAAPKERSVPQHVTVTGPEAAVAEPQITVAELKPVEATKLLESQKASKISFPKALPPKELASVTKTNFNDFETQARLSSDPSAYRHRLTPVTTNVTGSASVTWSTSTGDALIRLSDLKTTDESSAYVLYFVHKDGKAERVYGTQVVSGATMYFQLPKLPSHTVGSMVLTLERKVEGKKDVVRQEILRSRGAEKVVKQ